MKWRKLGIVWNTDGRQEWSRSHAMCPTPFVLDETTIRVYVTTLDGQGRGRGMFVDVDSIVPTRVKNVSPSPVLDIGSPGAFDDNGVVPLSVVRASEDEVYMYYAGFEICSGIRYRIFTGLAVSTDGGTTFHRHQRTPVLDRTDEELYFRCGPYVQRDQDKFRMWYVAGSSWLTLEGKPMPVYDIRYSESTDGIRWPNRGTTVLPITDSDEHGFGRPWAIHRSAGDHELWYSVRRKSFGAYRLGFARSSDGHTWQRADQEFGIDVSDAPFENEAVMYAAMVNIAGREYCFYNGNGFGRDGFAVAERLA